MNEWERRWFEMTSRRYRCPCGKWFERRMVHCLECKHHRVYLPKEDPDTERPCPRCREVTGVLISEYREMPAYTIHRNGSSDR